MDKRDVLLAHLARAEGQVAIGRENIRRQYRLIAELENEARDTEEAIVLLKSLLVLQEQDEKYRDLLRGELKEHEK